MEKLKSGLKIKLDEHRARRADLFRCPGCEIEILSDFGDIYVDETDIRADFEIHRYF
jgi:hypothetical protein